VVICGTRRKGLEQIRATAASGARLVFILEGPNSFGCALLAAEHRALPLSQAVADKQVKGVISFESDLSDELLDGIRVLGAADWRPTGLMARSEVFLPTCAWVEQYGTFVNNEGRAQGFRQVMQPGLPIKGLTPDLNPPREHRHAAPGGDVLPAWRVVAELIERLGGERFDYPPLGKWEALRGLDTERTGELLRRPE
jgi:NADH-quinone oxidoreductase subunit G